jgi:hypothetical protein
MLKHTLSSIAILAYLATPLSSMPVNSDSLLSKQEHEVKKETSKIDDFLSSEGGLEAVLPRIVNKYFDSGSSNKGVSYTLVRSLKDLNMDLSSKADSARVQYFLNMQRDKEQTYNVVIPGKNIILKINLRYQERLERVLVNCQELKLKINGQ